MDLSATRDIQLAALQFLSRLGKYQIMMKGILLFIAITLTLSQETCRGELYRYQSSGRLPKPNTSNAGFTVEIKMGVHLEAGYAPWNFLFKSPNLFTRDRNLVVRIKHLSELETPPVNGLEIEIPVHISQGDQTYQVTHFLPEWTAEQAASVEILENGDKLLGYRGLVKSTEVSDQLQLPSPRVKHLAILQREKFCNWLYVDQEDQWLNQSPHTLRGLLHCIEETPNLDWPKLIHVANNLSPKNTSAPVSDLTNSAAVNRNEVNTYSLDASEFWTRAIKTGQLKGIGFGELMDDWRAYQPFDVMVMSRRTRDKLDQYKKLSEAVHHWQLLGGTVVIVNHFPQLNFSEQDGKDNVKATLDPEQVSLMQNAAGMSASAQESINATNLSIAQLKEKIELATQANNETTPPNRNRSRRTESLAKKNARQTTPEQDRQQLDLLNRQTKILSGYAESLVDPKKLGMMVTSTGVGLTFELTASDGMAVPTNTGAIPSALKWRLIQLSLGARVSPTLRRGVNPLLGSNRFANWSVPGVSQPPVYTFIGLLSAFVILVGPVAYIKTTRAGRTYLMFAIAPIFASLTTLAMLGYSLIADGLGAKARIRQLTWVDGKSGMAVERVRATYFTGLQDDNELIFPRNSEVFPQYPRPEKSWADLEKEDAATLGRIRFDHQYQRLSNDFLPSRDQRQFIFHNTRTNVSGLSLIPEQVDATVGPSRPSARLRNDFEFPIQICIVRDQEGQYWQTLFLNSKQTKEAVPLLATAASRALGNLYIQHRPIANSTKTRRSNSRDIEDIPVEINNTIHLRTPMLDGLMENWIQQRMLTIGEIPKGYFVATAEVSDDVIAVKDCDTTSSVRFLFGTLP